MSRIFGASRLAAAAVMLAASAFSAHTQSASGPGDEIAPGLKGIGLTPAQKRIIYDNTSGERQQKVPDEKSLSVGTVIPDSLMLNEMPVHVKDEIGVLRDFKFVPLQGAQSILIVDPANRKIVEIVTKADAEK